MSPKPHQDPAADAVYMTVEEFAGLTSDQHHIIWAADIDTIPQGTIHRYHRAQVEALLAAAGTAAR